MIVLQVITISKSIIVWFFFQLCLNIFKIIPILRPYCPAIVSLHVFDHVLCSPSHSYASFPPHIQASLYICWTALFSPSLLLSVSGCVHVKLHSLTSKSSVRTPTGCLSTLQTPACVTAPSYLARQQAFSIDLVFL